MLTAPAIFKGLALLSIPSAVFAGGFLLNQTQPNIKTYLVSVEVKTPPAQPATQPTDELYTDTPKQAPIQKTSNLPVVAQAKPADSKTNKTKNYTCLLFTSYEDKSCKLQKVDTPSDSKYLTFEHIKKPSTTPTIPTKADLKTHNWFTLTVNLTNTPRSSSSPLSSITIQSNKSSETNKIYGYLKVESLIKTAEFSGQTDTFVGKVNLSTQTKSIPATDPTQKLTFDCKFKQHLDTAYSACTIFKFASGITDFKTTTDSLSTVTKIPDTSTTELTKDNHYIIKLSHPQYLEAIEPTTTFTLRVTKTDKTTETVDFTFAALLTQSFTDTNKKAAVLKYV